MQVLPFLELPNNKKGGCVAPGSAQSVLSDSVPAVDAFDLTDKS